MALKAAMWVPGTTVEAQNPGPWVNTTRAGWGTHFRMANQSNWFHVGLTTPVILDGARPKLAKVMLFFSTNGDAKIIAVHVYDGKQKVKTFDNLALAGDHSAAIDAANAFVFNPPIPVYFSLGISVCVQFGAADGAVPEIVFYSAGADFAP